MLDTGNTKHEEIQGTSMDPFCRQAWMEYGKRFCIYSATGLAVGAACAFVLLGLLFHLNISHR